MRFDQESALLLGWDKLQHALASFAYTDLGQKLCLSRQPMDTAAQIQLEQSRHRQLRFLLDQGKPPPLDALKDVEIHLQRAQKGGVLTTEAITEVARAMSVSSSIRRYLMVEGSGQNRDRNKTGETPGSLVDMARGSHDLTAIGRDLSGAFGPDGTLRDSASAELFSLRKKAEAISDSIRNRLERMIRTSRISAALSDPVVTMRAQRYVLPVRSHSRSEVKGIVHDTSQTGATLFIEPSSVVDDGNRLKIVRAAVAEEELKILSRYSQEIAQASDELRDNLRMLAELDMLNASVRLAVAMKGCLAELASQGFCLKGARHPLMAIRGEKTVPNDIQLPDGARTLILSGPNAGGKTVALKTLGLCCVMTQAGLAIPAEDGSRVGVFDHVAAVIGDAQDISSGLSTFSAHIKSIIDILNQASGSSLVLLDELAADTDPLQGAALATAILQELVDRGSIVVATTHYESLKVLAFEDRRFSNASVGFDLNQMKPTFSLRAQTPGRSLTMDIARRIGMPERVLERAAGAVQCDERNLERVLAELENERQKISSLSDELQKARREARRQAKEHDQARQRLEQKRRTLLENGRQEILADIYQARKEVSKLIEDLRQNSEMASVVAASHKLIEMENSYHEENSSEDNFREETKTKVLSNGWNPKPGDLVKLKNLGKTGRVISKQRRGRMLTVQLGSIRTRVALEQVQPIENGRSTQGRKPHDSNHALNRQSARQKASDPPSPMEVRSSENTLDIRGKRVDEALNTLDEFLDEIFSQGRPSVFIIHGHGTGALKAAVREHLADSPYARHFRSGTPEEGGDGVTVVAMR